MKKYGSSWLGMALAFAALVGLSGAAWAAEAPILKSLSGAEKARVAKLIAGAKKEGSFSWATNLAPVKAAKALEKDFKKYYGLPGVKFRFAMRKSGVIRTSVTEMFEARSTSSCASPRASSSDRIWRTRSPTLRTRTDCCSGVESFRAIRQVFR